MLSARDIIDRAARDLRIVDALDGEEFTRFLGQFNSMLSSWKASLTSADYAPFPTGKTMLEVDDTPQLEDQYEDALIALLAVQAAPAARRVPDPSVSERASTGWARLMVQYGVTDDTDHDEFTEFSSRRYRSFSGYSQ